MRKVINCPLIYEYFKVKICDKVQGKNLNLFMTDASSFSQKNFLKIFKYMQCFFHPIVYL